METVYKQMGYEPHFELTEWDFSRYIPDYVIIALGQNDANPTLSVFTKKNTVKSGRPYIRIWCLTLTKNTAARQDLSL